VLTRQLARAGEGRDANLLATLFATLSLLWLDVLLWPLIVSDSLNLRLGNSGGRGGLSVDGESRDLFREVLIVVLLL
jgi:hypothetical protein